MIDMVQKWNSLLIFAAITALLVSFSSQLSAQCESWEAHPDGKESAMEQHVIYRRLFEAKKYDEAFPLWEKLFAYVTTPKESKSVHFLDGITMYKVMAKAEKDKEKKKVLVEKMMKLYDDMAGCLGEKSTDRAYEGYNIYYVRGPKALAIKMFEKSIELGKKETHNMVLVPMAQLTVSMFMRNNPDYNDDYMRKLYETLKGIVDYNVEKKSKDAAAYQTKWEKVNKEFGKIGDKIWGCDFHVKEWKSKFEADKNNMEQNKEILKILKRKCGVENELYIAVDAIYGPWNRARLDSIAEANFEALCNYKKGNYKESKSQKARKAGDAVKADSLKAVAFEWYEKSLEDASSENCEISDAEKGDLAYRLADNYYRKGAYSKARSLCNKAASLKPGWGNPYMLIGTMYASSGKRCSGGKGTGWDAQVVAWAAMDMWSKAKKIDPSVAEKANKQIYKYKKYLPTKGEIFQRGLAVGSSYKVGCWINTTTTIRAGGEE
jgi:tetratricopeptide (TPR) repeat protein